MTEERRGIKPVMRLLLVDSTWIGGVVILLGILSVLLMFAWPSEGKTAGGTLILDDGTVLYSASEEEYQSNLQRYGDRIGSAEIGLKQRPPVLDWLAPIFGTVPFLFIGIYAAWRERSALRGWLRCGPREIGLGVAGGAVLIAVGWGFDLAYEALQVPMPDIEKYFRMLGPPSFIMFLGVVLAPFAEEFYFRGRLLNRIDPALGPGWGTAISTALFGLMHGFPTVLPAYLIFGYLLVVLRRRSGGLVAPMLAHAINNGVGLGLMLYGN